ncbi:acetyltransferase [Levilactobacillus tangyuanensis]|uniref:Acetyltransferase n=1 Tax=Levilactobacillus tangyuanensis TaxID=2486021 RepID=A0ABW1TRI7_9LACO|nr:acetyltransferase [Levilactobacillus tangyuanensis]
MVIKEVPGQLNLIAADQRLASLHYLALSDQTWVLEQLFVRPGQSAELADQLIRRFLEIAAEKSMVLKILDPYAKRYLSAHPTSLLAPNQLPVTGPGAVQPVSEHYPSLEEENTK